MADAPKMDAKVKQLWITKLKSGAVKQAHGMLEDDKGRMCCLGVLMDVQGRKPTEWAEFARNDDDDELNAADNIQGLLQTAEVPDEFAAALPVNEQDILAGLNDGTFKNYDLKRMQEEANLRLVLARGYTMEQLQTAWTFKKIAAYIERWL